MADSRIPAIARIVEHNGGAAALSGKVKEGDPIHPQQIRDWVKRGWGSEAHFPRLLPFAPPGVTIDDLYADRAIAEGRPPPPRILDTERRAGADRRASLGRRRYDVVEAGATPAPVPVDLPSNHVHDRRTTDKAAPGRHVERRKN